MYGEPAAASKDLGHTLAQESEESPNAQEGSAYAVIALIHNTLQLLEEVPAESHVVKLHEAIERGEGGVVEINDRKAPSGREPGGRRGDCVGIRPGELS